MILSFGILVLSACFFVVFGLFLSPLFTSVFTSVNEADEPFPIGDYGDRLPSFRARGPPELAR